MADRTYRIPHEFTAYKIDDEYCRWEGKKTHKELNVSGPVFPRFLEADFSTYEGFRAFTEDFGLDGLAHIQETQYQREVLKLLQGSSDEKTSSASIATYGSQYSLTGALGKVKQGKLPYISKSFLERFYREIRSALLIDHMLMKRFHKWLIEGKMPVLELEDKDRVSRLTVFWLASRAELVDSVADAGAKRLLGDARILTCRLRFHLKDVNAEPVFPEPRIFEISAFLANLDTTTRDKKRRQKKMEFFVKTTDWSKVDRKQVGWRFNFGSIISRCYMEMLDLIEDEAELKECANCRRPFVPSRKDEKFCPYPAPQYEARARNGRKTCKVVGPQRNYVAKLKKEGKLEQHVKKKSFLNRINYLRRTGKTEQLEKVMKEYERWKKEVK